MTSLQVTTHIAAARAIAPEQSEMSAAAISYLNISGTWRFSSAGAIGRMTVCQEPSPEPCKRFTGFMDYAIDDSNIIGIYFPSTLRIYFGRYKVGEPTPFQMHEGYVNNGAGNYMAGSFFVWGNGGPYGFAGANEFTAERLQ